MKSIVLVFFLFFSSIAWAQSTAQYNSDVTSPQSIVAALYEVISGSGGQERDWDRFRNLFTPESRLIPTGKNKEGDFTVRSISPEEYVQMFQKNIKKGFFEKEINQVVEEYGTVAHVFSTYETAEEPNGSPTNRGINSIQLFKDNNRYYVISVFWCAESMGFPIPEKYLN